MVSVSSYIPIARPASEPVAAVGHRNRLRYVEIVDDLAYLQLTAELVMDHPFGGAIPLPFVRSADGVRLRYPASLPDGLALSPCGAPEVNPNVAEALRRSFVSLVLHHQETGADIRLPAETSIEATPDIGPARRRQFAVRFGASAVVDLIADAAAGSWALSTELTALGSTTTAVVGPHRDIAMVDSILGRPQPGRVRAHLAGPDSQLVFEVRPGG